ncbi:MAG: ATP-binding cassette domain-containing protein [Candidatus Omnitrophica bacterium]|nr:ATP-binding cassette domain-containing protein [Candidatus Omnitrophota bacterium]MDD5355290.1 ATP-binding cassette domain-containing protein [Candidatus Omnitrophota bacterium]
MPKKIIEINNLDYSYPDGTKALSGINLDVLEGESIGIIGPNGAGKTSLLLHLNGILDGKGSVKVCGLQVEDKNLPFIRGKVGLVFQDPDSQLFMPTVFDDVAFGPMNMDMPKNKVLSAVEKALGEVDMLKAKEKIAHHLSFGEKKRVSIATVLSMNPEILALDEPTSNLDPKHRKNLIEFIKKAKLTKIIATHDLDLVLKVCSRVVILDKGNLVAQGASCDILSNKTLLEAHELELPLSLPENL